MARPRKRGLNYYPKDVDFYDDIKIMTLLDEFGPLGVTVYEVMLTFIYRDDGYYLELPTEHLAVHIIRKIGGRWVTERELVLRMIYRCVDLGLFDKELFAQGVFTSVGIQKRYAEVTARNKADRSKYWLLGQGDEQQSDRDMAPCGVNASETEVFDADTPVSAAKMQQSKLKQTKANKTKPNEIKAEQSKEPAPGEPGFACCAAHEEFERIKRLTPQEAERITELVCQYGEERVIAAMRDTLRKGGKSLAYVERILADAGNAAQLRNRCDTGRYQPSYDCGEVEALMYDEWFGEELTC